MKKIRQWTFRQETKWSHKQTKRASQSKSVHKHARMHRTCMIPTYSAYRIEIKLRIIFFRKQKPVNIMNFKSWTHTHSHSRTHIHKHTHTNLFLVDTFINYFYANLPEHFCSLYGVFSCCGWCFILPCVVVAAVTTAAAASA